MLQIQVRVLQIQVGVLQIQVRVLQIQGRGGRSRRFPPENIFFSLSNDSCLRNPPKYFSIHTYTCFNPICLTKHEGGDRYLLGFECGFADSLKAVVT